jgi:molecular chaperone HtpG
MSFVADAFEALVDQFKDPYAFLRELVQNSLDAGSSTIEVSVRGRRTSKEEHVVIEVMDFGEGMDRAIIENKLVRLFASGKDGDATKIGKFGIGFASVFAIRPAAVIVDTARGAERWRVLFGPDGSWRLFALEEPLEGTRVRVLKPPARGRSLEDEAARIAADARRTLSKWCRYADARILFDGASLAEPFDVPGPLSLRIPLEAPGDVLAIGLSDGPQIWGFYDKGLTLLEGTGSFESVPPWASFRVRYGALAHTITRDNVLRDDAFVRVMSRVLDAAHGVLLDSALAALESEHEARDAICRAVAAAHAAQALQKPARRMARKALRDARGGAVALVDVARAAAQKRVARVASHGPLAEALARDGRLVIKAPLHTGEGDLVVALGGPAALASDDHVAVVSATEKEQWSAAPLLASMRALLEDDVAIADVVAGRVHDATGALSEVPALLAPDVTRPVPRASHRASPASPVTRQKGQTRRWGGKKLGKSSKGRGDGRGVLVLNLSSPAIADAISLSSADVWLAAFLALRLARPEADIADGALAERAWQKRSAP